MRWLSGKSWRTAGMALALMLVTARAEAKFDSEYDVGMALIHLDMILTHLVSVKRTVHTHDEASLFLIEKMSRELKGLIQSQPLSKRCANLQQALVMTFRFREHYFDFIRTKRNSDSLSQMGYAMVAFQNGIGFDEEPYKMVKAHLQRLRLAIQELIESGSVPPDLTEKLQAVQRQLPTAIAVADRGDRPSAYREVVVLNPQIANLYGSLLKLVGQSPSDALILEIQAINEVLAEQAEVELNIIPVAPRKKNTER